jgi:hypothetical protein
VNATYLQTALLPAWLARLAALLLGLGAAFAAVWFLVKPSVASHAVAQARTVPAAQSQGAQSKGAQGHGAQNQAPASSKPPAVSLPSPAGLWKLNETSGNIAADSAGGHPATGVNTGHCGTGNCATFDGKDSVFITNTGPVLNTGQGQSFTVSAWVWLSSVSPSGLSTAVSQNGDVNSGFFLEFVGQGSCWAFSRVSSDVQGQPNTPFRALGCGGKLNTWTYLTGVFDASDNQEQIYVNGVLQGTATDPDPFASNHSLVIGAGEGNGGAINHWAGAIANVEVFNTALNSAQVKQLSTEMSS